MTRDGNVTDPWCRYLPALHRALADPGAQGGLPGGPQDLDFGETCVWWETLRYVLRALLGW